MDTPQPEGSWSTYDVCELTGASYRQVDYWIRTTPVLDHHARAGSGGRRRWTDEEVQRVDLMVRCRQSQIDLDTVRELASGGVGDPVLVGMAPGVMLQIEWRSIADIEADAAERMHREPVHTGGRTYRHPGRS